ncbi:MAG: histidine triad nucleotide-binding protein [Luteolibacter sp.]
MEKTLFQKIYDKEIPADMVHHDEVCCAFSDISPQAPVHVLIVPRKPIARIGDAEEGDAEILSHLLLTAGEMAKKLDIADSGFRVVINNGENGGETVPHLHVHLLGGRQMKWPPG